MSYLAHWDVGISDIIVVRPYHHDNQCATTSLIKEPDHWGSA